MSSTDTPPSVPTRSTAALDDGRMTTLVVGATGLAIVVWWVLRLERSLILDETITAWITDDGLAEAWSRASDHQGNGPAYFIFVWLWRQVAGGSEIALRLPSVVAGVATVVLTFRFVRGLGGELAGALAALTLVTSADFALRAGTARPYALQILFVTISMTALVRWTRTGRRSHAATWVAAGVTAIYLHPFGALLLVPQALYVFGLRRRREGPALRGLVAPATLGLIALVPQIIVVASLRSRAASLIIADVPGFDEVVRAIVPGAVLAALAVALFVSRGGSLGIDPRDGAHRLLVTWAVAPVAVLYVISLAGGDSLFVPRYYALSAVGVAMVAGLLVAGFRTPAGRHAGAGALIFFAFLQIAPAGVAEIQDWRAAVEWTTERADPADTLVLMDSGLIETGDPALLTRQGWGPYLTAPLSHYAPDFASVPLPFDGENPGYIADVVADAAQNWDQVALIANGDEFEYPSLITRELEARGWSAHPAPDRWRVDVIVYSH